MVNALACRDEASLPSSSRSDVLARYRHLRSVSKAHHSKVLSYLPKDAVLRTARRLGLARGKTLVLDSMDDLTLAFDLAIYAAPADRSRAIDRYARSARHVDGSDEALVLEAMRGARFAVVSVIRRHPSAGLIVMDLFRDAEVWLVDEGLEASMPEGSMVATRYYSPASFAMTAGVVVPVDLDFLASAIASAPHLMRKPQAEAIDDWRFAEAVYREAIAEGIMEDVEYRDPGGTAMPAERSVGSSGR